MGRGWLKKAKRKKSVFSLTFLFLGGMDDLAGMGAPLLLKTEPGLAFSPADRYSRINGNQNEKQ
jgi:hypothetical protein